VLDTGTEMEMEMETWIVLYDRDTDRDRDRDRDSDMKSICLSTVPLVYHRDHPLIYQESMI